MSIGLDVWIARPGCAAHVDGAAWRVTIYDALGKPYQWAGTVYSNLAAPHAHWAGTIPPGTYVVQAVNEASGAHTDHAIVTIEPMQASSVRLYVAGREDRPVRPGRPTGKKCEIVIETVIGTGGQPPRSVLVAGVAKGCTHVEVELRCRQKLVGTATATVSGSSWKIEISPSDREACRCDGPVSVVARCKENKDCVARFDTDRLQCRDVDVPR